MDKARDDKVRLTLKTAYHNAQISVLDLDHSEHLTKEVELLKGGHSKLNDTIFSLIKDKYVSTIALVCSKKASNSSCIFKN